MLHVMLHLLKLVYLVQLLQYVHHESLQLSGKTLTEIGAG